MADPTGVIINIALQAAIGLVLAALTPKQRNEGPRLDDRQITTSTYGDEILVGYGTVMVAGNIIWGKDIEEVTTVEEIGKGNPFSLGTNTTYTYFGTFAVALARREIETVLRIYADGKIIYDVESGDTPSRNAMPGLHFRLYKGNHSQDRDPLIEADVGTANCPAYRGIAYIVFNRLPLENFGNRIPSLRFVVAFKTSAGQPASYALDELEPYESLQGSDYDPERETVYTVGLRDDDASNGYLFAHDAFNGGLIYHRLKADISGSLGGSYHTARYVRAGKGSPYLLLRTSSSVTGHRFVLVDKDTMQAIAETAKASFPNQNAQTEFDPGAGSSFGPYVDGTAAYEIIEVPSGSAKRYFSVFLGNGQLLSNPGAGIGVCELTPSGFVWVWGSGTGTYQLSPDFIAGASGETIVQGPTRDNEADVFVTFVQDNTTPQNAKGPYHLCKFTVGSGPFSGFDTTPLITIPAQTTAGGGNQYLWYDPDTDILVWCLSGGDDALTRAYFMDSANDYANIELRWTNANSLGGSTPSTRFFDYSNGYIYTYNSVTRTIILYDIETGDVQEVITSDADDYPGGDGITWVPVSAGQMYYTEVNRRQIDARRGIFYRDPPQRRQGETLDVVVSDLVERSKLSATDIDVTDLATKTVQGYGPARGMPYRTALEPLMSAYNFYGVEKEGKLVFKFHDNIVDFSVPEDDLVRSGNENVFEEARGQELETPRALYVTHRDPDNFDLKNVQGARRISFPEETMGSVGEKSLEIPLYLTPDEGAEIAERLLFDSWIQRETFKFRLPARYLKTLPNDVLEITAQGRTEGIRANRVNVGANLEVEVEGSLVESDIYIQRITGIAPPGSPNYTPGGTTWNKADRVQGWYLDMPLLRDFDLDTRTKGLIYFSAGTAASSRGVFPGAGLVVAEDGSTFQGKAGIPVGAAWGILDAQMTDIPGIDWNSVQEIDVDITMFARTDQLASVTEDDMVQQDANTALLVRSDGTVEIIGFRDVSLVSGSTYRITGLMRGKRGTNSNAIGYPASGIVYFVLVDPAWVTGYFEPTSRNGATATYKILPAGPQAFSVEQQTQVLQLQSLMPYEPSHVTMTVNGADRDISWTRRTRQGGGMVGGVSTLPLSEDSESYEVDILSGSGGSVLRTLSSSTESVTYTAAQADIDFGTDFPNPLYVKVYQVSAQVGRGFSSERALMETL